MSLPHWIKWNKVKDKYVINNNMKCFEQVVKNTKAATVKNMSRGGDPSVTKAKRPFRGNTPSGSVVARGCGIVLGRKRKKTKGSVS